MKLFGIALFGAMVVGPASAQLGPHTDIWSPNEPVKDQQIKLIGWGSGSIAQATDVADDGAFSIRISTHNYFQGGILSFGAPKDVSKSYDDSANLLLITVRSADQVILHSAVPDAGNSAGAGGRFGGRGPGGGGNPSGGGDGSRGGDGSQAGAGGRPGSRGQGGAGQGGLAGGAQETTERASSRLTRIRVVITTTDGVKSEAYLPLPVTAHTPWHSIAVPLQKIAGFDKSNKIIQAIAFSGDATTTYYVGDIRLIHDATPITGEMNAKQPLNLALGDTVQFKGAGEAGSTVLRYEWCFDSANGFAVDTRGSVVKHRFRKAGKYVVTLMISDYYGAKKPFTTTVDVTVNP